MGERVDRKQCVVLLVEDEPDTYELYSEVLASAGFSVIGADSGEDAVRESLAHSPDLIVMDYELRGMNGVEATEWLKHEPRTAHIPVMMLTGHVARKQLERARAAGCDAFVSKPCPLDKLLDEVNRLVGARTRLPANRSVLVVEDDEAIRSAIMQLLADAGFEVAGATNGRAALHYLHHVLEPPGLILLDLMMPVMDGWTFRTQQLADPRLAEIPVIVLSAVSDLPQRVAELHVDEFLPKPLDLPRLLSSVDRHV